MRAPSTLTSQEQETPDRSFGGTGPSRTLFTQADPAPPHPRSSPSKGDTYTGVGRGSSGSYTSSRYWSGMSSGTTYYCGCCGSDTTSGRCSATPGPPAPAPRPGALGPPHTEQDLLRTDAGLESSSSTGTLEVLGTRVDQEPTLGSPGPTGSHAFRDSSRRLLLLPTGDLRKTSPLATHGDRWRGTQGISVAGGPV